ncbi:MAG: PD-(D/E)XK nuclease family protein [Roseiarcus sp.]
MRLTFSWFADSASWPERPGAGDAVLDQAVVGPNGLLDCVETMLGLGRPGVANVTRIAVYRRKIEAAGGSRFWSESFALDPWSSARELLRWRDDLIEAGWRPGLGGERRRLADLAAAETAGPALPPGRADRLCMVLAALDAGAGVRLRSLALVDARDALPAGWRALIDALERRGVTISEIAKPTTVTSVDSDLDRIAAGERNGPIRGDGSFTLLVADTELTAAEALAGWLAADGEGNSEVVFVASDDATLLDDALADYGLPRLGAAPASPHRALLQVLPLAFSLAWSPPDPNRLLDFFLLPMNPLGRFAAKRLAEAVAESPGVGGEAWTTAWDEIEKRLAEDDDQSEAKKRTERLVAWRELVEPARHDPAIGMPRAAARQIVGRVYAWAGRRFAADGDPLYLALTHIAGDLDAAIEATGLERLDRLLIERMIEESLDVAAADPGAITEAAPWRAVSHPGAIWGPAKTVVWWRFADTGETSAEARWNEQEREALATAGCPLDPPERELRRLAAAWERPLLHATERVLLVLPALAAGAETAIHPLWHELAARRNKLMQTVAVHAEDVLAAPAPSFAGRRLIRVVVPVAQEPATRTEWRAAAGAVKLRAMESPSSLESLLSCPLRWTLQYANRLRPGARKSLPRAEQTIGRIAHRIAEEFFRPGAPPPQGDVETTARLRFEGLLPQIGATLLLPEAATELAFARAAIPVAIVALGRFLVSERLTVVGMETEFEAPDALAPGTGVAGRIDLSARTVEGRPVVVDLKWYRTDSYLRRDLKLGVALQIAVYACNAFGANVAAAAGYFALRQRRFLAATPISGSVADIIEGQTPKETWDRTKAAYVAARADLDAGRVRATHEMRETKLEGFADPYLLTPPRCGYCDFAGVCGVEE